MKPTKRMVVPFALACPMALMVGCGDDVTNVYTENPKTVAKLESKKCDDEGRMVYVENEKTFYVCEDSAWVNTVKVAENVSCSMKALKNDSGYKVVCGGDSIGVVLNGKDGKDGKDGKTTDGSNGSDGKDGASCSVDSVGVDSLWIACGKTKAALAIPPLDSKTYNVKVQFLTLEEGASYYLQNKMQVYVQTLDSKSMLPIGEVFQLDKGSMGYTENHETSSLVVFPFEGNVRTDAGHYAKVVLYKDPMTLARYDDAVNSINLEALVDLDDTVAPAISYMSDLTYERVVDLVKGGKSLKEAKAQASSEFYKYLLGKDEKYADMDAYVSGKDSVPIEIETLFGSYEEYGSFYYYFREEFKSCFADSTTMEKCKTSFILPNTPLSAALGFFILQSDFSESFETIALMKERVFNLDHCDADLRYSVTDLDSSRWGTLYGIFPWENLYCDGSLWSMYITEKACEKDLTVDTLLEFNDNKYVCDSLKGKWTWRDATLFEKNYKAPCYSAVGYTRVVGNVTCTAGEWKEN